MSLDNQLLALCETLANKGMPPTVAMLRAKSPTPVPLPKAIAIVQQFQQGARALHIDDSDSHEEESASSANQDSSDYQALTRHIAQLETTVTQLTKRIESLEQKLANRDNN